MGETPATVWKSIFIFLAGLPYAVFRIVYFVATFPRRMRHVETYERAQKQIRFYRLSDVPISILRAVELIESLRLRDGELVIRKRPSIFDMLEALWSEETSEAWKLPTVNELMTIRNEILADLAMLPSLPRECVVGAIDEASHMFVACDVTSGTHTFVHPKHTHNLLRGWAPDSQEKCFAYAVSVSAAPDYLS